MHRLRLVLACAGLALVASVGFAGNAMAQTPANPVEETVHLAEQRGAKTTDAECIKLLAQGKTVEDCQKSPNPLLPAKNELIWGALGFLVVFGFIWKAGYPAIKKGMAARTERIRNDLETAEHQREEADQILAEYRTQLAEAKTESAHIIEEARQTADALRKDLETRAAADIADMKAKAATDIEAAKRQAIADLRHEVAELAISAAERVVERNLDDATNRALVEEFISQVGAGS
ncbi:MAG: synthase, subunit b [Acidimicrobiales bacterium]|nr:synthase, subunit b [Acidimicrobiales bacterium]